MTRCARFVFPSRWLWPVLFAVAVVMAGCGKKGPLYLPDEPPPPPGAPAPGK